MQGGDPPTAPAPHRAARQVQPAPVSMILPDPVIERLERQVVHDTAPADVAPRHLRHNDQAGKPIDVPPEESTKPLRLRHAIVTALPEAMEEQDDRPPLSSTIARRNGDGVGHGMGAKRDCLMNQRPDGSIRGPAACCQGCQR